MIAPLLLGLLSSLHCVGMCGPIALALPVHQFSFLKKTTSIILYHLGRIVTYCVLGFIFGSFGKGLFIAVFQQNLSIALGVLLICFVIFNTNTVLKKTISGNSRIFFILRKNFSNLISKKTLGSFFILGLLNGLLPCAMLYMALFGALSTQGGFYGVFFMLMYGLGTIPLLTAVVWVGQWISSQNTIKFQKTIPVLLCIMGVYLIIRGLGLEIPYLSPGTLQLFITGNPQCFT